MSAPTLTIEILATVAERTPATRTGRATGSSTATTKSASQVVFSTFQSQPASANGGFAWVDGYRHLPEVVAWNRLVHDAVYAELTDGRLLVVEYKGEPYKTNDDSREKQQVGYRWEQSSGGRCLFLFAVERDAQGRDVFKQIQDKLI